MEGERCAMDVSKCTRFLADRRDSFFERVSMRWISLVFFSFFFFLYSWMCHSYRTRV